MNYQTVSDIINIECKIKYAPDVIKIKPYLNLIKKWTIKMATIPNVDAV